MAKKAVLFGVSALLAAFSIAAEAKYYKWVDKDGRIHYETTMQPEDAAQHPVEMSGGRVVKKAEKAPDTAAKPAAATPEDQDKQRRDDALLGTFSSENEIDLARDRNLQQVNARISSIQMRLKTAQDDLDGYNKEKADLAAKGKQPDKALADLTDQAAAKLAKLKDDLAKSQAEAAAIHARYDADKQRYHELTSGAKK